MRVRTNKADKIYDNAYGSNFVKLYQWKTKKTKNKAYSKVSVC